MEKNTLLKSMIHLQKTYFDNYFSLITNLHEQAQNVLKNWTGPMPYTTEESKKAVENLRAIYKKQCENFKEAVDNGYSKIESFFDDDAMMRFQEQTEKMFNQFLRQSAWLPDDFKKSMENLAATYQKSWDDFRKYWEDSARRVRDFYPAAEKGPKKTSRKKRPVASRHKPGIQNAND